MLNKLNEVVKSKVSDDETVNSVMEVANQYELSHDEDFLIKCFGIAFLFHSKIKWTLDNYVLDDSYKGLWHLSVNYAKYSYHKEKMVSEHDFITIKSSTTLSRMFASILNLTKTYTNVEYIFCPCETKVVKDAYTGNETRYDLYTNLAITYNFIVKEENYNDLPRGNQEKEDKSLSVGDGMAVTAAMAGMGGLLAAPLLFL